MAEGDRRLTILLVSGWILISIVGNVVFPPNFYSRSDSITRSNFFSTPRFISCSQSQSFRGKDGPLHEHYESQCKIDVFTANLAVFALRALWLAPAIFIFLLMKYRRTTKNPFVWVKEGYERDRTNLDK